MAKTLAVIGLGSAGMRHALNLIAMGHRVYGFDVMADRKQMALDAGASEVPDPFDLRLCHGVVIATPTVHHVYDLIGAIDKSPPVPVLVEKPISHGQLLIVQGALMRAHRENCVVMTACNLRFHPCVKKAKEWLEQGLIGKPLWANFCVAQHTDKEPYKRDGVWLNWISHEADLALYLLGPATVTAAAGDESIADMCLLHEYGVRSTIHGDYHTKPESRVFSIFGTKGNLNVGLVERFAWIDLPNGLHYEFNAFQSDYAADYVEEMQAFIDLIDGKPRPEAATGADGLATLELILEAKRMAGLI